MDGENFSINRNSKLWLFTSKIDKFFIDDDDVLRRQSNDDMPQIVLPPNTTRTTLTNITRTTYCRTFGR